MHHNRCKCTTASALAASTTTHQLYDRFFGAFVADALAGAAS